MPETRSQTREVQNAALGAGLVWRAAAGYQEQREDSAGLPFTHLFLVLPLLLFADTAQHVESTNPSSGLLKFVSKISPDVLLAVHSRVDRLRDLSLESFRIGIVCGLLQLDTSSGTVMSLRKTMPDVYDAGTRDLLRSAHRLGRWFGATTPHELSAHLRVRF